MKNFNHFSKNAVLALAGVLLMAGFAACSDDDKKDTSAISEADAVDAITAATAESTNGLAKTITDASAVATDEFVYTTAPQINCGQEYTNTYNASSDAVNYSYNYTGSKTYELGCSATGIPQTFTFNGSMAGTYDTPRMNSDDTSTSTLTITNLGAGNPDAVFNGSYVRNGYQESKILQMRHFNSILTYTLSNISVNKSTHVISGGTATVSFVGTGSGGNTYTYNGAITFNGNSTATLVINGNTYTINL